MHFDQKVINSSRVRLIAKYCEADRSLRLTASLTVLLPVWKRWNEVSLRESLDMVVFGGM